MEVLDKLKELNIDFKLVEHEAVYTMEEIDNLGKDFFEGAKNCKNLFVRDQKGKKHFLIVISEESMSSLTKYTSYSVMFPILSDSDIVISLP